MLVDSEPISNRRARGDAHEQGLPTTLAQARREYQGLLLARDRRSRAERPSATICPTAGPSATKSERDAAFGRDLAPGGGRGGGGARRCAPRGCRCCVASQGRLQQDAPLAGLTGLAGLFHAQALFSAESVARGKPHPDLFLHAAAAMGAPPELAVVVEDTPSGVAAGVAAGMRVLGYAADSDEDALRAAGAETFVPMGEVPVRLGSAELPPRLRRRPRGRPRELLEQQHERAVGAPGHLREADLARAVAATRRR